jgi:hypothetical protein
LVIMGCDVKSASTKLVGKKCRTAEQ